MKDKIIGIALIAGIALAIAGVATLSHRLGDPSWAPAVITALVSALGLAVMWLKTAPEQSSLESPPKGGAP